MSARLAAARCLVAVAAGQSLSTALPEASAALAAPDRSLAQALVYATLRQVGTWRWLLGELLDKPLKPKELTRLEAVLGCALTELRNLSAPAHAVVHAAVASTRALGLDSAAGLVNAVLRRWLRESAALEVRLAALPLARMSHPDWLISRLRSAFGARLDAVCAGNVTQAPMWLRIHPRSGTAAHYAVQLPVAAHNVPGMPQALRLDQPLEVHALPGFAAGSCSVQDLAAQHCAWLLAVQPGESVLDACAAPGGKTAHLLEAGATRVLALDQDERRLDKVRETLKRLHLEGRVRSADATRPQTWWDGEAFDAILLDAPCSATGVIRRHPDILALRRDADIAALSVVQTTLLESLWPLLRPGGRMLYATCSLLPEENDLVVSRFLAAHPDAQERQWQSPVPGAFAEVRPHGRLNLPGAAAADGFYLALLVKARQAT